MTEKPLNRPSRKRATRAMDGALMLLIVLLVVQVWLLMASVEAWLAGHSDVAAPAAIMSALLFAGCLGLLLLALRAERGARLSRPGKSRLP
ncbi:MAG: hypothetical protein IT161_09510 [Bryobacterales bacterium]|nr:hypothetical protein [Bryobacterales bacterium]